MDSRDLTPDQLQALTDRLRPTLAYLNRLLRRMEAEGFPAQDKLYRTACEAEDRLQHLQSLGMTLGCQVWAFWPSWEPQQRKGLQELLLILSHEPSYPSRNPGILYLAH